MMMSIVWTIVSYVLGALLRMREKAMDAQLEQQKALMKLAGMKFKDTADARDVQTSEAQFTRRLVMLVVTFCLMFVMVWGVLKGGTMIQPITVTESGGFLSMIFGGGTNSTIEFIKVPLTMTVSLAWDLFSIMVGFYFGSGGTRR